MNERFREYCCLLDIESQLILYSKQARQSGEGESGVDLKFKIRLMKQNGRSQ